MSTLYRLVAIVSTRDARFRLIIFNSFLSFHVDEVLVRLSVDVYLILGMSDVEVVLVETVLVDSVGGGGGGCHCCDLKGNSGCLWCSRGIRRYGCWCQKLWKRVVYRCLGRQVYFQVLYPSGRHEG